MRKPSLFLAALAASSLLSCPGGERGEAQPVSRLADEEVSAGLEALAARRVFFGHQSVGRNIIDGLVELNASAGRAPFRVVETREAAAIVGPGLYHAAIGRNKDPMGKLGDFEALLRGGIGASVDVAILKFCYVDIDRNTDVEALYAAYRGTMDRLSADFHHLVLLRCSVPLTAEEGGLRGIAARFLRRGSFADNERREAFNRLLRADCSGKRPLFDLALAEASADSAPLLAAGGKPHHSLRLEYSLDGGHLNAAGARRAAAWLAASLAASLP